MSGFLTIVNILGAASEEPQGIAALGIDPLAILAQAGTFLVLFWVIKKFALDGIISTLEKRRQTIDDGVRLGREMESEKSQLKTTIEAELRKARIEADKIIASGNKEAGEIIKEAELSARSKVDTMIKEAHNKLDEDVVSARESLRAEIIDLVADATAIITEEKLDSKKDMSIIEKALTKMRGV